MAATVVGFSWVNYTSASVVEKDEDDLSIIKSHAMRVVHYQRHRRQPVKRSSKQQTLTSRRPTTSRGKPSCLTRDSFVNRPLETDWEGLAISHFMEDFVYPEGSSPDNAFQYLDFLPRLYNKYSARSCLTEAVTAVALARLANQVGGVDLSLRARESFASALSLVNKSLGKPDTRESDHVLTTLCLLTKYETVMGDAIDSDWRNRHERGQAAIIQQRGEQQLKTEIGVRLFRLIYIRQLLNCIAQCERPAMWLRPGSWALAFPMYRLRKLMKLIAEVALVLHAAAMIMSQTPRNLEEACRIVEYAVKVDTEMTSFINGLPPDMDYQTIPNSLHPKQESGECYFPGTHYIFRDLQHASFWHVFWYARIHLLRKILQYSSYKLEHDPDALRSRLQETVNNICSSVPYALGEEGCPKVSVTNKGGRSVAAHYLIWVLAAASSVDSVHVPQKHWISDRLKDIGHVHGIKQALVFA